MTANDVAALKRSLLLGARVRFSPSGATIRSQAIERIIEQNLAAVQPPNGLTEQQLQNLVMVGGQFRVLRASDVRQGIASLTQSKRVLEITDGKRRRYALSDAAKEEVAHIISDAEGRTNSTISDLFGTAPGGQKRYRRPFLRLLCHVFSRLSDVYVQIITLSHASAEIAEHRLLIAALEVVLKAGEIPDQEAFRYGVNRFFRESSPHFDQIKWNMAQNFYVAKALGIDESSDILSIDVFKGAALYCDTNVLIAGLTPENRHHSSFNELSAACKVVGMELKVSHATVEELNAVIIAHASLLRKVYGQIPDETRPKVRNFLLEAFLDERVRSPNLSLDDFVEGFQQPLKTLRDSFGIVEEDDRWFDSALEARETRQLATDLSNLYKERRGRPKPERSAVHDAVLLRWVARENLANRKSWIVTLDTTLAEWNGANRESRVITLDAFLQWMNPVALGKGRGDEDRLAEIFSEAIRYQLLPRDIFLRLGDFQVFAEMGIETRQLPAADVEACIREIRQAGPQLDPAKAEDRERIGQVIQRYFADPGTKYKQTIHELHAVTAALSSEVAEEKRLRADAQNRVGELRTAIEAKEKRIEEEQGALGDARSRIESLEGLIRKQEESARHRRLVTSVIRRTFLSFCILGIVEGIIVYAAWKYGEGPNLFQRITNAWPWLGLGLACVALFFRYVLMGRERMQLLKWWKGDDK